MAPSQASSQVVALLASVRDLHSEISTAVPGRALNGEILLLIETSLEQIPSLTGLPEDTRREFDTIGTALWNTCGRGISTRFDRREDHKILGRAKAIAFILVDAIAPNTVAGNLRGLKTALSTAQSCMESSLLRLALRTLEAGAQRLDSLKRPGNSIESARLESFTVEYFTLRTRLAWLQHRVDIAEHLFSQIPLGNPIANRNIVIKMCYHIGCDAISAREFHQGVKWLGRALEQMPRLQKDNIMEEAELRNLSLLVRHALARAYLNLGTDEAKSRLEEQLDILKKEHKEDLAVKFLELEFIRDRADQEEIDVTQFFDVLEIIVHSVDFTEQNFLAVFAYIKYSQCLSHELCLKALQSMILHLPVEQNQLVVKAFIRLVALATTSKASEETRLACIRETAKALEVRGFEILDPDAAHACLIFIWKLVDHRFRNGQHSSAGNWCQLALETNILQNCSEDNKLKIKKKLVLCALKDQDVTLARETLEGMSTHNFFDSDDDYFDVNLHIMYLRYRLSLQEGCSVSFISDCMQGIPPEVDDCQKKFFIRVCALEAQLLGNQQAVIACVHALISYTQSEHSTDRKISIADLQFSIYLLITELEKRDMDEASKGMILNLLKLALPAAQRPSDDEEFSREELEWACRAGYSLARNLLTNSQTEYLQEALAVTEEFLLLLKAKVSKDNVIAERLLIRVTYLSVIWHALAIRSRNCDDEEKRARYEAISEHIRNVRGLRSRQDEDNMAIFRNLWALGIEAALYNQDWNEFLRFYYHTLGHMSESMYAQFLESMLAFEMPHGYRVLLVQNMICNLYNPSSRDPSNRRVFPFFLRTLFELCLAAKSPDGDIEPVSKRPGEITSRRKLTFFETAEFVLEQIIATAADEVYISSAEHQQMHISRKSATELSHSPCGQFPFPKEELIRLASVAFNQAVDFYSMERDDEYQRWAKKAIRLAEVIGDADGNELAGVFRKRLAGLI